MRLTLTNLGQLETIRVTTSIRRLVFVHPIWQIRRHIPNIQLARHHIRNQSSSVFIHEFDLSASTFTIGAFILLMRCSSIER